jgi:translation elongation factor EF-Ts
MKHWRGEYMKEIANGLIKKLRDITGAKASIPECKKILHILDEIISATVKFIANEQYLEKIQEPIVL